MRKIVIYPAEILRRKTEEIKEVDKKLLLEIKDLQKVLKNQENGAGLAAPQIGISKRFFGSKEMGNKESVVVFINPKIVKSYGEKVYPKLVDEKGKEEDFLEGCLSFPSFFGTVKRFLKIEVSWQEVVGAYGNTPVHLIKKNKVLNGFEAIVWQHEADHLDGIVFIDHIKEEGGKFYKEVAGKMEKTEISNF